MDIRILGSLQVLVGPGQVELGPPKQRALLAILALHAREVLSVDRLIDDLWPDRAPRTAAHSIQIYVSELRKALAAIAPDAIVTRSPGYVLDIPPRAVDARRFEELVDSGLRQLRDGSVPAGMVTIREALGLWNGPPLADFAYEEFAQPHIRHLTDRHLDALEALAAAELDAGDPGIALDLAERAIRDDPLRERARDVQIRALYAVGRHAEALRSYERYATLLDDELGLEPSPSIRRVHERILLHDVTLLPTSPGAAPPDHRRNPYKGLRSFTEQDAADFFGRDALVEVMVELLGRGQRLIALVGPSGSGKSSVLAAGLIPRLRAGAIAGGSSWEIAEAIPAAWRDGPSPSLLMPAPGRRRLVILDQFEDLFSVADEGTRRDVLGAISAAVHDPHGPIVVLALRADAYDKPLLHAEFAALFVPSVIHVLPLTTDELNAAIVRPAEGAGLSVEASLVGELIVDTAAQPGALPLLQFALSELCEQSTGAALRLDAYREMGGLRRILSGRAEELYGELDETGQQVARQVFLRLVLPGGGATDSRRRVRLSELTDIQLDPVALSDVLDRFGRHRLLSFDRDPATGAAIVELAHEALLREWQRLAAWVDRHRAALRRHVAFAAAAEEWESAGRDPDYLLTGSRLSEFETTIRDAVLQLSSHERAFLDASAERRRADEAAVAARTAASRRLERSARTRLIALGVTVAALVVVIAYAALGAGAARRPAVGLVYTGDAMFTVALLIADGFDRGVTDTGLTARKVSVNGSDTADAALRTLSTQGTGLVVVEAPDANVDPVAADFPGVLYVVFDQPVTQSNAVHLAFADNQSSFLAGVAAAETSRTGTIGFIGGTDNAIIWPFEAGFEAGARAVNPSIRILATYLAPDGDLEGAFEDPVHAEALATAQYGAGADVVFVAAGDSGTGVYRAATDLSASTGSQLWAIGVDTDQWEAVSHNPANTDWRAWQGHILTSVLKRMDNAVHDVLTDFANGQLVAGTRSLGLASQGVGLATSGGFLDAIQPQIDSWSSRIVAGSVAVPCIPVGREVQASGLSSPPPGCGG